MPKTLQGVQLTPEVAGTILSGIRRGLSIKAAAGAAGIPKVKLVTWRNKGVEDIMSDVDSIYAQFEMDCVKYESEVESEVLTAILDNADTNARQWYLSRRFANEWDLKTLEKGPLTSEEIEIRSKQVDAMGERSLDAVKAKVEKYEKILNGDRDI